MNTKRLSYLFLLITLLCFNTMSQTYYFPMQGKSSNDFSSAYGPRNLGSTEYPNTGYNYDFHAGIDIAAPNGTNVYPILDGIIKKIQNSAEDNNYVEVQHTDSDGEFLVRYMHITPSSSLYNGKTVTGGTEILGTVLDYKNNGTSDDHLDVRYFPNNEPPTNGTFANADNPGKILTGTNIDPDPEFIDLSNNVINEWSPGSLTLQNADPTTGFQNPSTKRYFTVGVRVEDDELDLNNVRIHLTGNKMSGGTCSESQLLYNNNTWSSIEYYYPEEVRYFDKDLSESWGTKRVSCGDRVSEDDDWGHNSTSIGIIPKIFSTTGDYHKVFSRWYVNDTYWNDCYSVTAELTATDWDGDYVWITNVPINNPSCVGCIPDPNAPGPPILISATYQSSNSSIRLYWERGSGSPGYFRIYRCPASRAMTDNDVIGITNDNGNTYTEYFDSSIELIPGVEYKYAVAGVNYHGEGLNSNEQNVVYSGQVSGSISQNTIWGSRIVVGNVTVNSGVTLTVTPGSFISFASGASLTVNGVLIANGTLFSPITFTSTSGASPGNWGSIVLSGPATSGSTLNYLTVQYGTDVQFLNGANVTLQNSQIKNCTRGVYVYCSEPDVIGNLIDEPQTDGIVCSGPNYTPLIQNNTILDNSCANI